MSETTETRELYRVTVALPGAAAGDHVLVDTSDPEIAELIEGTFLVKAEPEEAQAASEELAEASPEPGDDASAAVEEPEPVAEEVSPVEALEPVDEEGPTGPFASHPR